MIEQMATVFGHFSVAGSGRGENVHLLASQTGWFGNLSLSPGIPNFCSVVRSGGAMVTARPATPFSRPATVRGTTPPGFPFAVAARCHASPCHNTKPCMVPPSRRPASTSQSRRRCKLENDLKIAGIGDRVVVTGAFTYDTRLSSTYVSGGGADPFGQPSETGLLSWLLPPVASKYGSAL